MSENGNQIRERAEHAAEERRSMEKDLRKSSSVYNAMVQQMATVYGEKRHKDGLSQTEALLIALGMAVHSGSESQIDWTITRALNHGATTQMIQEVVDIALVNGGSFVVSNARFAAGVLTLRDVADRRRASGRSHREFALEELSV